MIIAFVDAPLSYVKKKEGVEIQKGVVFPDFVRISTLQYRAIESAHIQVVVDRDPAHRPRHHVDKFL